LQQQQQQQQQHFQEDLFDDRNAQQAYQRPSNASMSSSENPFADSRGSINAHLPYNQEEKGQHSIHPIAIPAPLSAELTIGAKPVMPGNLAPQFAQSATPHKYDASASVANQGAFVKVLPALEKNEPSGTEKDPFADLF